MELLGIIRSCGESEEVICGTEAVWETQEWSYLDLRLCK